jgi:hypothetical protein
MYYSEKSEYLVPGRTIVMTVHHLGCSEVAERAVRGRPPMREGRGDGKVNPMLSLPEPGDSSSVDSGESFTVCPRTELAGPTNRHGRFLSRDGIPGTRVSS